jgi:predicted ribosomally synthesized peptide with nif11-like leader
MSVENVKKFYQRMEEDEAFRAAVANENSSNTEKVIAVAARHGYEFTETDYAAAMENGELSDSELEQIAGGERKSTDRSVVRSSPCKDRR